VHHRQRVIFQTHTTCFVERWWQGGMHTTLRCASLRLLQRHTQLRCICSRWLRCDARGWWAGHEGWEEEHLHSTANHKARRNHTRTCACSCAGARSRAACASRPLCRCAFPMYAWCPVLRRCSHGAAHPEPSIWRASAGVERSGSWSGLEVGWRCLPAGRSRDRHGTCSFRGCRVSVVYC
jgi:hypothetical protein